MPASRQSPKLKFGQDPHATRETSEKVLEVAIGREIHAFRKQQNITVAELAAETNLSIGMLSKIENGNKLITGLEQAIDLTAQGWSKI